MVSLRIFAISLVTAGIAVLSAAAAAAMVFESPSPHLAARLPVYNGFGKAELGQQIIGDSVRPDSLLVLDWPKARAQRVKALSLLALRQEPLSATAVSNVALATATEGNLSEARKLMRDAHRLTRRNLMTNIWLMTDYSKRQNLSLALDSLDDSLRSNDGARPLLIRTLVQNLTHPEMVGVVAQLLGSEPPWADDFWHESYRVPAALPNVARLRVKVHKQNIDVQEAYDRGLLTELTRNRLYDDAKMVFDVVDAHDAQGQIVHNAGFTSTPRFLPFDWQTFFDSSLTADLLASAGKLVIRSYEGGSGTAAQQLVSLEPGTYEMSVKFADSKPQDRDALTISLDCAEDAGARSTFRHLSNDTVQTIVVPQGGCHYYWLKLSVFPETRDQTSTIVVDSISLPRRSGDRG